MTERELKRSGRFHLTWLLLRFWRKAEMGRYTGEEVMELVKWDTVRGTVRHIPSIVD